MEQAKKKQKHLVVIEDNVNLCALVHSYFELNYRVTTFRDGESCLAAVEQIADANIVIVDYQLANMNGIELFLALRPHLPKAKYIFTTGYLTPEMAEEGMKLGFDSLILKPFDFSILEKNINDLLRA